MQQSIYEQIASKAEWEGGLDEALDWYKENELPDDLQLLWRDAIRLKADFQDALQQIAEVIEQHGVEF